MTPTQPQEDTARIKRDELLRLLNVTSPVGYQAITARTRLDEVAAELARTAAAAPLLEPAAEVVSAPVVNLEPPANVARGSKRRSPRPFSQVAALLPSVTVSRPPRATPPPPAPKTVSGVRERLERGEDLSSTPWLSARVAAHLTAEEIAMLPMDLRLRLPAVAAWQAPPRIELTPMPGLPCIDLQPGPEQASADAAARAGTPALVESRVVALALYVAFLLLGSCAVYAVL